MNNNNNNNDTGNREENGDDQKRQNNDQRKQNRIDQHIEIMHYMNYGYTTGGGQPQQGQRTTPATTPRGVANPAHTVEEPQWALFNSGGWARGLLNNIAGYVPYFNRRPQAPVRASMSTPNLAMEPLAPRGARPPAQSVVCMSRGLKRRADTSDDDEQAAKRARNERKRVSFSDDLCEIIHFTKDT